MAEIQVLCAADGVFPCEFDAAAFASTNAAEWPDDTVGSQDRVVVSQEVRTAGLALIETSATTGGVIRR